MSRQARSVWMGAALLGAVGCNGEGPAAECEVVPGDTWEAPDFATNAAEALAVRARLDAFASARMREAETGAATVDVPTLEGLYDDGDPSVKSLTTPTWRPYVDDAFTDFVEVIDAGVQDLVASDGTWDPGSAGGIFEVDSRGIDEGGIEVRQIVDKGLFGGGVLYPYALSLTEGPIEPGTVEAIAAAWGADAALDPEVRTDSANYSHGMGYYAGISEQIVAAHAYAADPACEAERDEALYTTFRLWEGSLMARFVFYANAASPLLAAPGSDNDVAKALHALAEGLGLGLGFAGVPDPSVGPLAGTGRVATDADVAAMIALFGVVPGDLGASTTGDYVSDPTGYQDAVEDLETMVGEVYGLSAEEVAAFRTPTGG